MGRIDHKELINPFIVFPIIFIITILAGLRLDYSLLIFLIFSFMHNVIIVLKKSVTKYYYMFVYSTFFYSLIFLIPLFYLIKQPYIMIFVLFGAADLLIQLLFNLKRKDGKNIIRLWKKDFLYSERERFHPISTQRYYFKDFSCRIIKLTGFNLARNYYISHDFFKFRLREKVLKERFSNKNIIAFDIFDIELKEKSRLVNGLLRSPKIYSGLSKKVKLITCYKNENTLRLVFDKDYVYHNPERIYDFLKKLKGDLK